MNRKFRNIFVILLIIIACSCSPVYYLNVQLGKPAKNQLPSYIQSLTLVIRSADSTMYDYNKDTLQRLFYKKSFRVDTVLSDRTATDTVIRALGDLLFESGRYDVVIPEERFLPHKTNAFLSEAMPWNEVAELCDTFKTDAVLSLDYFRTSIVTNYGQETMYAGLQDRYFSAYRATIGIEYQALFRVYDPAKQQIVNSTVLKDTLWWDQTDLSNSALFSKLTSVKDALIQTGIAVALDYSDKIGTIWHNDTRKYFTKGGPLFEQAETAANKNDWNKALQLWTTAANQAGNKALRSKAEYNVALAYEMLGDIDQAIEWGVKSYKTQYRPLTYDYLNILKNRKEELDKISNNE